MWARAVEAAKFSKISFVVIVYDKYSSELNFENFQIDILRMSTRAVEANKFSRISFVDIVYSNLVAS